MQATERNVIRRASAKRFPVRQGRACNPRPSALSQRRRRGPPQRPSHLPRKSGPFELLRYHGIEWSRSGPAGGTEYTEPPRAGGVPPLPRRGARGGRAKRLRVQVRHAHAREHMLILACAREEAREGKVREGDREGEAKRWGRCAYRKLHLTRWRPSCPHRRSCYAGSAGRPRGGSHKHTQAPSRRGVAYTS